MWDDFLNWASSSSPTQWLSALGQLGNLGSNIYGMMNYSGGGGGGGMPTTIAPPQPQPVQTPTFDFQGLNDLLASLAGGGGGGGAGPVGPDPQVLLNRYTTGKANLQERGVYSGGAVDPQALMQLFGITDPQQIQQLLALLNQGGGSSSSGAASPGALAG